ncbi:signal recognition particle subunit FFH/SRP54 (srp54) [Lachnospiraceae bacterium NK3A20]|nr:signal recognition particle subunit FFH/SRP54 (srp54) [Lachnospiraceae bacterium NK3A20]
MAFESLTEKLNNVFRRLSGKGKLTEEDVKAALREVKMALLEADVNFKVVKQFIGSIQERAVGTEVMNGLNPAQQVIKIVNEEMIRLMGSETTELSFQPGKALTVIMMAGLQGSGKTTTASKLAGQLRKKGRKPLLAALDVYRPGAIRQLEVNGDKVGVPVFTVEGNNHPVGIAKEAVAYALTNHFDTLFLDTAGRLQIDEEMMQELVDIKAAVTVHETILIVDAMTGQEAVNVAKTFDEKVGIDGVILSKMDGDTRGGAALSVKAVTGKPILYVGMGEKLEDLEQFYPDRMASRILGMGDVLTLIDKAKASMDEEDEKKNLEMGTKLKKGKFDFDDYLESMKQMRKMGGLRTIMGMMPNLGISKDDLDNAIDEKKMARIEAIVLSMTPAERANPKLLTPQRKYRIAKGSGNDIAEVNRFIKQFKQMQDMVKKMPGIMGGRKRHGNPFGALGGLGGFGGRGGRFF